MDRPASLQEWILKRLRYHIDLREKSVAAVEKELGWSRGYLGDALRGEKRLSLESLLRVLDHLEIDLGEFVTGSTPEEERWGKYPRPASAEGVADGGSVAAAEAFAGGQEDARALVLAVIRVLEAKGVLDRDDLISALAQRRS